jgi:uncharacterized protein YidB (DUF937 family)
MGLLDGVIGMLTGGAPGDQSAGALMQHLGELLGGDAPGGGLSGLVQSFESSGLGPIIRSWIGSGQNLPITPEQLHQALGHERIAQMAQALGLDSGQVTNHLAEILPQIIDHLTPNGQIPTGGVAHSDIMGALSSRFGSASPPTS